MAEAVQTEEVRELLRAEAEAQDSRASVRSEEVLVASCQLAVVVLILMVWSLVTKLATEELVEGCS